MVSSTEIHLQGVIENSLVDDLSSRQLGKSNQGDGIGIFPESMLAHNIRSARALIWHMAISIFGIAVAIQIVVINNYYIFSHSPLSIWTVNSILAAIILESIAIGYLIFSREKARLRAFQIVTVNFLSCLALVSIAGQSNSGWYFIPLIYVCMLILSFRVGGDCTSVCIERIGALEPSLSAELISRLGGEVILITDAQSEPSSYDVILVDLNGVHNLSSEWASFLSRATLADCKIQHARTYAVRRTAQLSPQDVEPNSLRRKVRSSPYIKAKRSIDIIVSVLITPIALLLGGLAALAILINMGRPILFRQSRVGRNGTVFTMYKLRTMRLHDLGGNEIATAKSDCRITPFGSFLRRYRIDELPQLINVIKGDMSLIGPRPEQPKLVEEYLRSIPYYNLRHDVLPGLSGWAQVTFGYASTAEETQQKLGYDLFYIKEFGLSLDIKIAVATVRTVIMGSNAR